MPNASACKQVNIAFPIEMNTIPSPNGIVKTVESEKEIFNCKVTGGAPAEFGIRPSKRSQYLLKYLRILRMEKQSRCPNLQHA